MELPCHESQRPHLWTVGPPISEMTNDQLLCAIGEVDSFFGQPEWGGLWHTLFKLHCLSTEDPSAFTPSFDQLDEWVKDK